MPGADEVTNCMTVTMHGKCMAWLDMRVDKHMEGKKTIVGSLVNKHTPFPWSRGKGFKETRVIEEE